MRLPPRYDFSRNTKWEKHKPSRTKLEGQAQGISQQDRQQQAQDYSTAQGTLSQFEGPVQQSPYYKSLLATSTDATSNAYENAKANSAAKAKAAGFGYDSPIGEAASRETTGQEAGALAELPAKTAAAAAPLSLAAAGETASMGTELGKEGTQYFGDAAGLEKQYQQMNQDFWDKLASAGAGIFEQNPYGIFGQQ